jgi:hypothetical protein
MKFWLLDNRMSCALKFRHLRPECPDTKREHADLFSFGLNLFGAAKQARVTAAKEKGESKVLSPFSYVDGC